MADTGELCRVTVVAPRMRLDVAVPHEVPLAHLLPTLLWHSGEQLAEEGVAHGGWVLQRAGEGPLDAGLTMAALGVRDGDILYLRTREGAAPAPVVYDTAYDDTADAITSTLRERARRWSHADSRVAALGAIAVMLAAGAFGLAVAGGAGSVGAGSVGVAAGGAATKLVIALIAAGIAAAALLGAASASRAFADATLATVIALGGLPYAFVAGLLALPGLTGSGGGLAPAFLVGSTVFLIAAAFSVAAIGHAASLLTGAVAAGFVGVAGGLIAVATSAAGGAAAVVSLALIATPAIAPIAYRVARLPRPVVPATPEDLRQRPEPPEFADVPKRTVAADRVVGAFVCASGAVTVVAVAIMLRQPGWAAPALAALAGGLLLLRARLFAGIAPRAWLLGAGLLSLVLLVGLEAGRWPVSAVAAVAVAAAVASALVAWAQAARRRPSPPLARAVDLAELIATIATVPVALDVIGVFHAVRVLGG